MKYILLSSLIALTFVAASAGAADRKLVCSYTAYVSRQVVASQSLITIEQGVNDRIEQIPGMPEGTKVILSVVGPEVTIQAGFAQDRRAIAWGTTDAQLRIIEGNKELYAHCMLR